MQNTFELPDGGAVTLFGAGCTVKQAMELLQSKISS